MWSARSWGATAAEEAAALPCDALLPDAPLVLHRAVPVEASAAVVFRWLCQLRAAPYSYDALDNLGRRSPQSLTPGLEELAVGQRVMSIFRVASFAPDDHLTVRHRGPVFGAVAVTYAVRPGRLLMRVRWRPGVLRPLAALLAVGDLIMARRQLRNLKELAER